MASALETLAKILKLEREQGYKNTAVIGGLAKYSDTWEQQAREQAKKSHHYVLVDELSELLKQYESIHEQDKRAERVSYMLDRIMGRLPAPPEYQAKQVDIPEPDMASETQTPKEAIDKDTQEKPPHQKKRQERQERPKKDNRKRRDSSRKQDKRSSGRYDEVPSYEWEKDFELEVIGELDIEEFPTLARPPRRPRVPYSFEEALVQYEALNADVVTVKGVGDKLAETLANVDVYTVNDLLYYLPRRYDDYRKMTYIRDLSVGQVAKIIGTITRSNVVSGKNNRRDLLINFEDTTGSMEVRFFGQHYLAGQLRTNRQVVLSGKVTQYRGKLQMSNPEWEPIDVENLHTAGIVPVYPLTAGLTARAFRRQVKKTLDEWAGQIPDFIPEGTLERSELADIGWALEQIHFPESYDHLEHARKRLVFNELLTLQLAIMANRREWQGIPSDPIVVDDEFLDKFISTVFPYELTSAQNRAVMAIREDIAKEVPMNRLIQGDVGSGKTAVAVVAMAMAYQQGKQSALMAPTSILAEQHYRGIRETLAQTPMEQKPVIALLTSALTDSERDSIYRGLQDGSIDMVIGTHALIQGGVEFRDLGIAIVDEQHRFGVEQRGALRGKGKNPHLLVMTATPIPRTMALTLYADLDLTIIDEKPPGRQPVETKIIEPIARERVNGFIEGQLEQGRQAFIVHPLVEESEKIDTASAVEAYERLSQVFYQYRVCLLHGRMSPLEKDEIMGTFANHEYDVMVTTSVAEVGVDVPNASVIVIEGANRFGLAQLHQFRGRVGRGQNQSYCLLIPDRNADISIDRIRNYQAGKNVELTIQEQRLEAMESTDDGFRLAELDWKLRGAGDLLGTRQSGKHQLKLVEEMSPKLVELAQQEARTIYFDDPYLEAPEHQLLARQVKMLHDEDSDIS